MSDDRFQRLKLLIGEENFDKLSKSTVAIFGVGGVGSFAVEALARSGVGHLVLIDKDNVDTTNINRQIHALSSTVGRSKVEIMRERIREINPAAQVDAIQKFFLPSENVEDFFICRYDYVVDAIDTLTAKIFLVEECKRRGIKIISSMGAGNKLDATRFKVGDIFQTSVDPVAKIMRKKLKDKKIKSLKVVWSDETPRPVKEIIGSAAFVPSVAGLILAGEVVKDLMRNAQSKNFRRVVDMKWVCNICGYEYDEEQGDPDNGIEPGTKFEDLPDDFVCPLCGVGKDDFSEVE